MTFKLPVLPTYISLPGDYRTKKQILEQVEKSKKWKKEKQ